MAFAFSAIAVTLFGLVASNANAAEPLRPHTPAQIKPGEPRMVLRGPAPNPRALRALANRHKRVGTCGGADLPAVRQDLRAWAGEELAYELKVAGLYVGRVEMKVGGARNIASQDVVPLFGRARTSGFVAGFKPFSGRYMAMVDPTTLDATGIRVESRYGEDDRWERTRFSNDAKAVNTEYLHRGSKGSRQFASSGSIMEVMGLLYFARTRELPTEGETCQQVFGARRIWNVSAKFMGKRNVDTRAGTKSAFLIRTKFVRVPHAEYDRGVARPPPVEVDILLSDDDQRTPLSFEIRAKQASATGTLVRWAKNGSESSWTF